jgi:hypothetical protein|tara:strand:+ start:2422 stop:3033 length:612 start_codon:yes stop_codon:yes gene_type:complete
MEIANIVSYDSINIGPEFNVVQSMDDIIYKDLPTLIVGYDLAMSYFNKDSINILNKQIDKNTFWTLKRNVKRDVYSNDLESFIRFSYKKYTDNISFVDLDFIQYSKVKMMKVIRKIYSLTNVISYKSNNNVIYLYSGNLIFSIDLSTISFLGLDVDKIEAKVIEKSSVFLKGNEILIEYNNHLERLNQQIKYIPVLYSINPHE